MRQNKVQSKAEISFYLHVMTYASTILPGLGKIRKLINEEVQQTEI